MPFTQRRYCATLIPASALAEDIESLADAGQLPTKELDADSAEQAMRVAHQQSGLRVLKAERIGEAA
ncbi:hypothetical protein QRO08_16745 [Paracidovorax citrulli]|uniref:Uncharacterized protein n=1 Tax=Paracidovorax citrulli TaxID=80869 RepID=A0ABY9AKW6_PARCI|nr:hypothetical protein [Paracidovorax citrulli]ATG94792.1 hypothetical protein CQB05_12745 [Paracidovorax citrulli]PVY66385.1 hypothetical protein C8E08_3792 [Paracidovorax citrulli]REG69444.1 hypothetical protein C8E07_2595 [Paracidovorax citrulli]RLJ93998.1 hypothetical protein C8E06_2594 [Paracidovorax citrulli]UMT84140.1 hypothetical protein FRC75_12625 [Paracidovorax citrulli]